MTQQKLVTILEEKNRVGSTWKYRVADNEGIEFTLQTKVEPKDWDPQLVIGKSYIIPMVQPAGAKYYNVNDDSLDLVSEVGEREPEPELSTALDLLAEEETRDFHVASDSTALYYNPVHNALPTQQEVKDYYEHYKFVKLTIIDKTDLVTVNTSEGPKDYLKKSGFRKFIQAFRLSLTILNRIERTGTLGIEYEVMVRCTAPNGQYVDGIAICQQFEKNGNRSKHDTLATAITRAKNRAISDLVALGEVSAEELG